jgi:Uma2 family endonuclease
LPDERVPKGDIAIAPDLAVESVSPNDTYEEVEVKVGEYLRAGVRLVWVISPETRTLLVRRPDKTATTLDTTDTLGGEGVIPGFTCLVGDLFV